MLKRNVMPNLESIIKYALTSHRGGKKVAQVRRKLRSHWVSPRVGWAEENYADYEQSLSYRWEIVIITMLREQAISRLIRVALRIELEFEQKEHAKKNTRASAKFACSRKRDRHDHEVSHLPQRERQTASEVEMTMQRVNLMNIGFRSTCLTFQRYHTNHKKTFPLRMRKY